MTERILPSGRKIAVTRSLTPMQNRDEVLRARGGEALVHAIARLGDTLGDQFSSLLKRPPPPGKDITDARHWPLTTLLFYIRCVLDAMIAVEATGRKVTSILQFSDTPAIKAILDHFMTEEESGQNASRILRGLRPLIRMLGGIVPRYMRHAISYASHTPRRGEDKDLPSAEDCRAAAAEELADALRMLANTKTWKRGQTRLRDAVIYLVELHVFFRRNELAHVCLEGIHEDKFRTQIKLVVSGEHSKVREVQLGWITDLQAIAAIKRLQGKRRTGRFFETNAGHPLSSHDAYRALIRTSARSPVGTALSFNDARRIGVTEQTTMDGLHRAGRHASNSQVPEQAYARHDDSLGQDECRAVATQRATEIDQDAIGARWDGRFRSRQRPRSGARP